MKPMKVNEKLTAIAPVLDMEALARDLQAVFDKHNIRQIKTGVNGILGYEGGDAETFCMEDCHVQSWHKPSSFIVIGNEDN